jgi:flavin-binding protein dodecin
LEKADAIHERIGKARHLKTRRDSMTVARVTEVIGMSPLGWKEALDEALNRANKTLRNITHVEILRQDATISNGKITDYRVTCHFTFILED